MPVNSNNKLYLRTFLDKKFYVRGKKLINRVFKNSALEFINKIRVKQCSN